MSDFEVAVFGMIGAALLVRYLTPPTLARWRAWHRTPATTTHLVTVLRATRRRRELIGGLTVEELLGIGAMLGYALAVVAVILTAAG